MKPWILIVIMAMAMCAAGCKHQDDLTSSVMDLYQQYAAHSENLTVAFVGDYEHDSQIYNALMLRAENEEEWAWLKEEFGIMSMEDLSTIADGDTAGEHHGIIIKPLEIPEEVQMAGEEAIQKFVDSVAEALRKEILGDSAHLAMAPIVAHVDSLHEGELREKMNRQSEMVNFSHMHGDAGYILNADIQHRTLWFFFYTDKEEQATLTHNFKNKQM